MDAAIELAHLVQVVWVGEVGTSREDRAFYGYRAECSCGWVSDDYGEDDAEAEAAGVDHREVAVGPPDRFDRFMSGLLDVQDDIAAAVVWLAENWGAGLPVPRWYGDGAEDSDRPAIRVQVYCDLWEMAAVSGVLGVEVIEDTTPDTRGNRYRRARRAFGRVLIEAFTAAPTVCGGCGHGFDGERCPTCGQRADAAGTVELAGYDTAVAS